MDKNQRTMCESIQMFNAGKFNSPDRTTQIDAGWFDWFCRDESLFKKTNNLYKKIQTIAFSKKFDMNKVRIFFKNNCPMDGILYDSFSIVDIETDDVLFWITPSNGHKSLKGKAVVASRDNDLTSNVVEGSWKDVIKFFMN